MVLSVRKITCDSARSRTRRPTVRPAVMEGIEPVYVLLEKPNVVSRKSEYFDEAKCSSTSSKSANDVGRCFDSLDLY
jgi:hypothetical protein